MDGTHPKADLDAPMSNLEGEEDQYLSGEEEEEDMDNEDSSGVNPPMPHLGGGRTPSPPHTDYFSRRSSPEDPEQHLEERKRIERDLLAQKELMIKRDETTPLYLGNSNNGRGGSSSKSETPSPSSPQQTQYLYAANYNYAAAVAAASLFSPQHLAAAAAAQASASAQQQAGGPPHHPGALPAMGGGGESSTGSATPPNNGTADDQSKYTFEEQFKQLKDRDGESKEKSSFNQLYEINDDPRRREFLDDLFNFMQKRGTPVNRVPIMAKQVLDLYELYRLVVARGGLVEVINKKIWREITKGLNLPSSITSAAFTLRTQYMRYLYPYECDREKLSTTDELQAAIDGNRREGRRSSYGPYGELVSPAAVAVSRNSQHPPLSSPLSLVSRHVNGHGSTPGGLSSGRGSASPLPLSYFHSNSTPAQLPLNLAHQENGLYSSHGLSSGLPNEQDIDGTSSIKELYNFQQKYGLFPHAGMFPFFPTYQLMMGKISDYVGRESEIVEFDKKWRHRVENNGSRVEKSSSWNSSKSRIKQEDDGTNGCVENVSGEEDNCNSIPSTPNAMVMPQQEALNLEISRNSSTTDHKPLNMKRKPQEEESMSTTKRLLNDDERYSQRAGMPHAHIKLGNNRGPDGRLQSETTLAISMEVNGILYQGVLYASPNHRNRL